MAAPDFSYWLELGGVAVLTSVVSGVMGMAGGMLLLAVMGFLNGRPEFLDIAIVYGLLNVVGTIAVLKFFRYGDLGVPGEPSEPST